MKTISKHNSLKSFFSFYFLQLVVLCISFAFGIAHMLTLCLSESGKGVFNYTRIPLGMGLFCLLLILVVSTINWQQSRNNFHAVVVSDRKLFVYCFSLFLLISTIWLLIYYPGVGMYDSIAIINDQNFTSAKQHPWFYILLIKCLVKFSFLLGGDFETALLLESILQILLSSLICSHCIIWMKNKGVDRNLILISIIFFAFDPLINMYTIALFKDIPFAYLIVEWTMMLYDVWETNGNALANRLFMFKAILCIMLSLLRNNGVYVTAFILLCLLLFYKKYWNYIIKFLFALLLIIIISIVFEKTHNITHLFKETVGVPLQQIAATVCAEGTITDEQYNFINEILPIEFIKEHYNPYSADTLKWGGSPINNTFLNHHKLQFLKVWWQMLFPNFKTYVKAFLQVTYGFWSTSVTHVDKYSSIYVLALDDWFVNNDIDIQIIFPDDVQSYLEKVTFNSVEGLGEGQLFWLFALIMLALLLITNDKHILIIGTPIFGSWLTLMISTPVAHQWRYILYIPLCLPMLIGCLSIKYSYASPTSDVLIE